MQLTSQGQAHDEIDFEFLGSVTGEPYTLHTNIYTQGNGNREKQFRPRYAFDTYSILWNKQKLMYVKDNYLCSLLCSS